MSEMEEKLNAILGNPQMMQQLMGMAQALGASQAAQAPPSPNTPEPPTNPERTIPQAPALDPGMLQSLAGLAQQGSVDKNQQTLLTALQPYLSRDRVAKLERAMRAARLANAASAFLNAGGLKMLTGR